MYTSPAQCAPSAPFHCAVEPSLQTVAPAHSIDAASSAVCTGPVVATQSLVPFEIVSISLLQEFVSSPSGKPKILFEVVEDLPVF